MAYELVRRFGSKVHSVRARTPCTSSYAVMFWLDKCFYVPFQYFFDNDSLDEKSECSKASNRAMTEAVIALNDPWCHHTKSPPDRIPRLPFWIGWIKKSLWRASRWDPSPGTKGKICFHQSCDWNVKNNLALLCLINDHWLCFDLRHSSHLEINIILMYEY